MSGKRKIFGLMGAAGSGKSTLAKYLLADQPNFCRLSFAGPLKAMIEKLLSIQGVSQQTAFEMLYGNLKEQPTDFLGGCSPRYAMQTLGTEWRDLLNRELWTNIWLNQADRLRSHDIVAEDLRFLHEAEAVRKLGGRIILIERPPESGQSELSHISEQEYKQIHPDLIIYNDETPEWMLSQLKSLGELK